MDEKVKNSCPNCCQTYSLKSLAPEPKSNIPLLIKCGHSMCERCIRNIVKFGEPIECKICLRTMEIKTTDIAMLLQNKIQLYKLFPVNISALGELTLDLIAEKPEEVETKADEHFIDLQAILNSTDQTQGQCLECHSATSKMCQQCATIICDDCFDKTHKNFVVFKNHILQNIEPTSTNNCRVHSQKTLEYYCKDCAKSICMDCLIVGSEKSCKSHDVVSMVEINEKFLKDLRVIFPKVDSTFRGLSKTAVDIGHLLLNMDNDGGSPELRAVTATIEQHFSKLQAVVQNHRQEVLENVGRLRRIERESLLRTRTDVAAALKHCNQVINSLKSALDCQKNQTTNLSALLEEAKTIVEIPWCLSKEQSEKDKLKVSVSEELCLLVSDYVQLSGNAQARYSLRSSSQLPEATPPRALVFPPILPKDVRFNKPKPGKTAAASEASNDKAGPVRTDKRNPRRYSPELKRTAVQTVMPFAEKKPSVELKTAVQELAHITYMRDPHHFFVRRVCDDQLLAKMEEHLYESLGNLPRDAAIGKLYAVKYENSWRRGRVEEIDEEMRPTKYRVFCVDFGSEASVSAEVLREIPSTLYPGPDSRYPALAQLCRLANCVPNNEWTTEDTDLVLRMVNNSPVTLFVRRRDASCECDVTTRGGASVAHALSFHCRAALADPSLPYVEVANATGPRLQPANISIRSSRSVDVLVTHVVSPDKFYVRETHLQADYVKLCEELNKTYDPQDESDLIYLPKKGMVCVVFDAEEGGPRWARAVVQTAPEAAAVRLWLPDVGCQRTAPWHRLRPIRPRYTALRALAIETHLAGLRPVDGRWPELAGELLAQRAGRQLHLLVQERQWRSLGAVLIDLAGPVCLNQELIDKQLATADGAIDFEALTGQYQPLKQEENATSPLSGNTTNTSYETLTKSYQYDFQPVSKDSLRLEAKVLECESPSLIYISLVHQQKTFNELFEDIQKFYAKRKTPRRFPWIVNDRCCAFCIQSGTWRRAIITQKEKDQVTVFYTDFAQTETVPISNLKKLHSDFEVIGDAAIKCHLTGVLPADSEWPSLTKEFLKDKLEEYKRVFVTKVGEFEEKSMPVQLWVYHTELGSALEPNESEWRCLNMELVSRGLALPDARQIASEPVPGAQDEDLRFLNIRGPVQSWLQPRADSRASCQPERAAWLPPEPLRAADLTAVPTYIDNDGIIYLHDVSQEDDLELIRDTLKIAFKEEDPRAPHYSWRAGEPCVARFYLDNLFYRGVVVEAHPDTADCLVQYVDYGNSETCAYTDLRKRLALHQIPIQAHKVSLARIKPVGGTWDLTVLDYIHKAIVEKKCFVKVVGPSVDDVTPVDLKYDKLWINDHLVEFDMADYTDGSKPIDRKYKEETKHPSTTPSKNDISAKNSDTVIEINSGSEPDYIVEEDIASSEASGSPDSFKMSTLMDSKAAKDSTSPVSYLRVEEREFTCTIPVINDTDSVELMIIHDEETQSTYEGLFELVKDQGNNMPALNGIFEHKPCIALFEGHWYRACILKHSEARKLLKVQYVDYGNVGIVPLSDVREISRDWACLPPACVTARLHGVRANPKLSQDDVTKAYIDTFLDKSPFRATIIDYVEYDNSVPFVEVELRDGDGELVYKKLIEDNVFLHDRSDSSTSSEVH